MLAFRSELKSLAVMYALRFRYRGYLQTVAVSHSHDLGSFTTLRLPDLGTPFLAEAKPPSMNASRTIPKRLCELGQMSRAGFYC